MVEALGGHGIFGVEFFIRGDQAIFSELSPRPHDTGMVTLIRQFPNEFELHLRAILGLPIPAIELARPVGLGGHPRRPRRATDFAFEGVAEALALGAPGQPVDLRIFAKPKTLKNRRMGVALARGENAEDAVERAKAAAARVRIRYSGLKEEPMRRIADRDPRWLRRARRLRQQPSRSSRPHQPTIKVRSQEQKQLHQLDAFNLAIALKRAIYDAGYTCKRVTDAGFVGTWKNLDMWMAHCVYDNGPARDWAIFAGPDGSAQVRDCKDVAGDAACPPARSRSARRAASRT